MTSLVATGAPAPIRRGSRTGASSFSPHTSSCFRSSSSSWRCSWCRSATPPGPACSGADSSAARSSPGSTTTLALTDPGFLEGLRRGRSSCSFRCRSCSASRWSSRSFSTAGARGSRALRLLIFLPYAGARCRRDPHVGLPLRRDFGPIGQAFRAVGLEAPNFFSEQNMLGAIMNVVTWSFVGYNMVIMYSALRVIPRALRSCRDRRRVPAPNRLEHQDPRDPPSNLADSDLLDHRQLPDLQRAAAVRRPRTDGDRRCLHAELLRLQRRLREPRRRLRGRHRVPARDRDRSGGVRRAIQLAASPGA